MAHYQMILAYDGTEYSGFQRQAGKAAGRTIQSGVEDALHAIGWSGRSILAAGRTDAGVHAAGQVIAFDFDWHHSDQELMAALNANLPADIAIRRVSQARPEFHPRYDAAWRRYQYSLFCQPVRDPLRERYAWRVWPETDRDLLESAAAFLVGEHDFGAFGHPPHSGGSTVRQVFEANWMLGIEGMTFQITANGFLYRMVRRIVSLLVSVGQGAVDMQMVSHYLQNGSDKYVRSLAPAQGLTLVEVGYTG